MVFLFDEQYLALAGDTLSLERKVKEKDERIEKLEAENIQLRQFCEEFNALSVAEENQKLKEEIKTLKEVIYDLDGLECPKCGNYHRRGWTCSQCGYGK